MVLKTFASGSTIQQWEIGDRVIAARGLPFKGTVINPPTESLGVYVHLDEGPCWWFWPSELEALEDD